MALPDADGALEAKELLAGAVGEVEMVGDTVTLLGTLGLAEGVGPEYVVKL